MHKYSWKRQLGNAAKTSAGWTKKGATHSFSRKILKPALLGLAVLFGLANAAMAAPLSDLLQASDEPIPQVAAAVNIAVPAVVTTEIRAEVNRESDSNSESSVEVKVNGEEVPINQNGSTHETIETEDGRVTIDVDASGCDLSSSVRIRSRSSTNSQSSSYSHSSATSTECRAD